MILLDGKKLAEKILGEVKTEVSQFQKQLRIAVVVVGDDPVVRSFIAQKKKKAESVGIDVRIYPFDDSITTNALRDRLSEIVHEEHNTGIIVQLPLPSHINTQTILNAVTPEKDIDVLSARALGNFVVGKSLVLPPVAGAAKAFFDEYQIDVRKKYIVVAGAGNLVGKPVVLWLLNEKATISVVRSETENSKRFFSEADIIISGTGVPHLIRGDMVKEGVIVIDAGTSESQGKIVGDVDFDSVSKKASYITPVPGGVGPVSVAMLLKNVVTLAKCQRR